MIASLSTVQVVPLPDTVISHLSPSDTPPPHVELIVIESVAASVVMVIFVPATSVSVSVVESATTSDCPDTAMVLNRLWSPVFVPDRLLPVIAQVTARSPAPLRVILLVGVLSAVHEAPALAV